MSPSTLRRYRAERMLRQEFAGLREEVLRSVRGRLRAHGVQLDDGDLEACYAQAWQGLYTGIAAGEEVANPAGWLTVVTFRRAIDEHRSARRLASEEQAATEPDLAAELDDRARLRQLFEALRSRLGPRECEAASLCYLQGLTRAQAAQRMGISEARMTKLMEGRGPGRPGVAGKVGELLETVAGGRWCEQQGSLMRGFAFGILDPRGERYRLARMHQRECPACRAYVLSLRGLAAVLPPLPLPWVVGLGPASHTASPRASHFTRTPPTHTASAKAGANAGTGGAVAASGAAGAGGAAGGGWLLGGSVGAKLAVGCLVALSVGCVAITATPHHVDGAGRGHPHRKPPVASAYLADAPRTLAGSASLAGSTLTGSGAERSPATATRYSSPAARAAAVKRAADRHAQREFGLEQPAAATAAASSSAQFPATARAASVAQPGTTDVTDATANAAEPSSGSATTPTSTPSPPPSHAEREFGPE